MKVNWKVRMKKKSFWLAVVSILGIIIINLGETFGIDYSNFVDRWTGAITSILGALTAIGVIDDMTSKGGSDTPMAMTYDEPRDPKKLNHTVDWETNINSKAEAKKQAYVEEVEHERKLDKEEITRLRKEREEQNQREQDQQLLKEDDTMENETTINGLDEEQEVEDKDFMVQVNDNGIKNIKPPVEQIVYDESQPFTDDADDVEFTIVDDVELWEDDSDLKGAHEDDPDTDLIAPPEDEERTSEQSDIKEIKADVKEVKEVQRKEDD